MAKINWLKVASIVLPVVGAAIGFVSDKVSEQQRRIEINDEINSEVERIFAERFGTEETDEDEELI